MKKRTTSADSTFKRGSSAGTSFGSAALNLIVKLAYRRHSRGRIAREAMLSCLGS